MCPPFYRGDDLSKPYEDFMSNHVLVLDVGTTGVKALIFSADGELINKSYKRIAKAIAPGGIVEQDPNEILHSSIEVIRQALEHALINGITLSSIGITNQRETTIIWDSKTGIPVHPAIVWEDSRTKVICNGFEESERERVSKLTGLSIDTYFSATKIKWIMDHCEKGMEEVLFGTVDSWLMWNILEGKPHYTDITNASRTLLFDVHREGWSDELLGIFGISKNLLPVVQASSGLYGTLRHELFDLPIAMRSVMGDQESSMFAAGNARGATKVTYGTGTFVGQIIGKSFNLYDNFFTTPTAGGDKSFMIEAKIDCCGNKVDPFVGIPDKFNPIIDELTDKVSHYISKLPITPTKIIVDGGLVRTPYTYEALKEKTGIPIEVQDPYDGTALGVARMLLAKS